MSHQFSSRSKPQEEPCLSALLGKDAFFMVNKKIVRLVGVEAALLLSELVSKSDACANDEGWFYETREEIEAYTTLSPHKQRECIKKLVSAGFLETKEAGIPARTHYRIFNNKLLNFLTTGCQKISQLYNKKEITKMERENISCEISHSNSSLDGMSDFKPDGVCLSAPPEAEQRKKAGLRIEEKRGGEETEAFNELSSPSSSAPSTLNEPCEALDVFDEDLIKPAEATCPPENRSDPLLENPLAEFFQKKKQREAKQDRSRRSLRSSFARSSFSPRGSSVRRRVQDDKDDQSPPFSPATDKPSFAPLSPEEIWTIAWELNVDMEVVKEKQQEILERVADGSWNPSWGNTLAFAIKTFLRADIRRGYVSRLDEIGRLALADDHPKHVERRKKILEELVKKGVL